MMPQIFSTTMLLIVSTVVLIWPMVLLKAALGSVAVPVTPGVPPGGTGPPGLGGLIWGPEGGLGNSPGPGMVGPDWGSVPPRSPMASMVIEFSFTSKYRGSVMSEAET